LNDFQVELLSLQAGHRNTLDEDLDSLKAHLIGRGDAWGRGFWILCQSGRSQPVVEAGRLVYQKVFWKSPGDH